MEPDSTCTEVGLTFHPFNIHRNVQFVFWCVSYTDIRRGERGHVLASVSVRVSVGVFV